jgi:CheY-like chemotaxis protein
MERDPGMMDQLSALKRRKLILLVEDDAAHASVLYHIIRQETPYYVCFTPDGETAWKFLQHMTPDLLILDYFLPGMNGLELYNRIRANTRLKGLPVLLVSAALPLAALSQQDEREQRLDSLSKPFELEELLQTIDRLMIAPCQ